MKRIKLPKRINFKINELIKKNIKRNSINAKNVHARKLTDLFQADMRNITKLRIKKFRLPHEQFRRRGRS